MEKPDNKFILSMVKDLKRGKMEPNMMEIGEMVWLKVKELFTMLMAIYIQR